MLINFSLFFWLNFVAGVEVYFRIEFDKKMSESTNPEQPASEVFNTVQLCKKLVVRVAG